MTEIWLSISNVYGLEEFTNFEMNQQGVLRNTKTTRIIEGAKNNRGYIQFCLRHDGMKSNAMKHILLADLWVWNPDNKPLVDHKDRDKLNNSIENLRWCTPDENCRNRSISSRNTTGELNISKCLRRGLPRWRVHFASRDCSERRYAGRCDKVFKRDPNSDVIPNEVIKYRDEYAKKWKGEFNPT